jgi:hypothetical protein
MLMRIRLGTLCPLCALPLFVMACWNAASVAAEPAQCEKVLNFQLTFQKSLDTIATQALTYPDGRTGGLFWGKPAALGGAAKTHEAVAFVDEKMRTTPNALSEMMNTNGALTHDADQVAFFQMPGGQQQLMLFGKAGCAVNVVVINLRGIFNLSPARYFLVPGGGVVLGR